MVVGGDEEAVALASPKKSTFFATIRAESQFNLDFFHISDERFFDKYLISLLVAVDGRSGDAPPPPPVRLCFRARVAATALLCQAPPTAAVWEEEDGARPPQPLPRYSGPSSQS